MNLEIPQNEAERLACLEALEVDFSAPAAELRGLAQVASALAEAPIALISLVEEHEQRFLVNIGLEGTAGTVRENAFCAQAILESAPMVIADTHEDARFRDNPLVTGHPRLRAYAGAALEPSPGMRVGTLCVLDTRPRVFSPEVVAHLERLARAASALLTAQRDKLALRQRLNSVREQERQLKLAAERDALTGLLNPVAFRNHVQGRLSAAGEQGLPGGTLAILDVDHLKRVNDTQGHPFGDAYLREMARALEAAMGPGGVTGRIGGDEFAAFLPASPGRGGRSAERVLKAVRVGMAAVARRLGQRDMGGVSIGYCTARDAAAVEYETLYRRADLALYAAKNAGRGRTVAFSAELETRSDREEMRSRFATALSLGRIRAVFQPEVCLRKGHIRTFEALARWVEPAGGVHYPHFFKAMLNDRAVGPQLTRRILHDCIGVLRRWRLSGAPDVAMAVNLSVHDLCDAGFVAETDRQIMAAGLGWEDFIFEVTELVVMDEFDHDLFEVLQRMRDLGARIALDDFGTGFAGLRHLRDWPVDMIKIDKTFIDRLAHEPRDREIVAATLALARKLGLRTVAEGIETEAQAGLLRELGCDKGQGFLFSRPLDQDGALDMLERLNRRPPAAIGGPAAE
ncbi:MAG: EAL domain-containing protein [Roseovarius sp.]